MLAINHGSMINKISLIDKNSSYVSERNRKSGICSCITWSWFVSLSFKSLRRKYFLGRTLYISKLLDKANWGIYKSRKVHFGLLGKFALRFFLRTIFSIFHSDGDYVFADLRGEFTHLLNFNVQLNFLNHLFFPNDPTSLPYDSKYTTQRGLINKISTLIYEKKNFFTYTIEISPDKLIKSISSITIQSIISYALIASKDTTIIQQILEKILFELYDDLNTKTYLMEILTGKIQ
jgi:hypothetical protein